VNEGKGTVYMLSLSPPSPKGELASARLVVTFILFENKNALMQD